jgi:hypothetical protein
MNEEEVNNWINSIGLSKRCRNLQRDFADAVLMSEVIHKFYPKLVDLHNYESALKVETKIYNWSTLNTKTLKKLGMPLDKETIQGLGNSQPGYIYKVLNTFKDVLDGKITKGAGAVEKKKKKKKEKPPEPMNDEERELYISKIFESKKQKDMIRVLEAKYEKLMELMCLKDAQIIKVMENTRK